MIQVSDTRFRSDSGGWAGCLAALGAASSSPDIRRDSVRRALGLCAGMVSAAGAALIRPGAGDSGWLVECVGEREAWTRGWISERLAPSVSETMLALCSGGYREPFPVVLNLGDGLMVMFGEEPGAAETVPDSVRSGVRTLIEVEKLESAYLTRESTALAGLESAGRREDPANLESADGLTEVLSLAREVSGADFTYWGSVSEGVVEVEWNFGASDSGFGFELPLGEGIGGRAFDRGETFEVADYLNCRYRYPGVSEATDSEKVRTALAIPVHGERSGAVLYAVRREIESFTEAQRIMLDRIKAEIQPVPETWSSPGRLYLSSRDHLLLQKSELRRLLLECDRVCDLEAWLERIVRGPVIIVDGCGRPYLPTNLSRLEDLETSDRRRSFPLPDDRASGGSLEVWSPDELPPGSWPDLIEDALAAFGVVLDRVEQTRERLGRQRSQWLRNVSKGPTSDDLLRDGNRLGLPVGSGEVWAFAWAFARDFVRDAEREQPRLRMLAGDVVLDLLGGPLILMEDGVGVVLLREPSRKEPSAVRDELLRHVGPAPLWLAHGASYETLGGLQGALLRATSAVTGLRRTDNGSFVTGVDGRNLASLIGNPVLSEGLTAFARKMLAPLIEHDEERDTELTRTFCKTLTLGSPSEAAREFYVHPNTIRYRMKRAEEILQADLGRPEDLTALSLAAFVWLGVDS